MRHIISNSNMKKQKEKKDDEIVMIALYKYKQEMKFMKRVSMKQVTNGNVDKKL